MAITGTIAAVVTVGSSIAQYREAKKQNNLQRQILRQEKKSRDLAAIRERAQQVRRARAARAEVVNRAAVTGTTGSSGEAGGVASIGSQLGANLSFLDRNIGIQNNIFNAQTGILNSQMRQGLFGLIGGIGQSVAGAAFGASGGDTSASAAGAGRHTAIPTTRTGALSPTYGL